MSRKIVPLLFATALGVGLAPASAQDDDRAPPPNAMKLSEIVAKVEQRDGFRYIDEIEWERGLYEVTYYTTDKAKVEIRFDPLTGEPK
ncbi:PepSY domain-containing protein [Aquamicrobium ahrensii]|uniref:PepSY domain-containing protein n=1 Tax=Aquamicrobium ahrensii TaxID=469551 RepID=A0ABV2KKF2_9HYPH